MALAASLSVNLKERQKDALKRMLNLNADDSDDSKRGAGAGGGSGASATANGGAAMWKALIYDDYCKEIVAPLMHVHELRALGVTVNFPLMSPRERVPDVPAIYFVRPTEENIDRIAQDMAAKLYDVFYLNFSSSVSHALIDRLARANLKSRTTARIAKVFDQYTEFVALEPALVHLNHRNSFMSLNGSSDEKLMKYIGAVADSLFSIAVTWGVPPIIRCAPNCVAEEAAERLNEKLREHLKSKVNLFGAATSFHRPVVILLDRNVDLTVPLQHPWNYQALLHDLLDMESNRVKCRVESEVTDKKAAAQGAAAATRKVVRFEKYDLNDPADSFWRAHAGDGFSKVGEAVSAMIKEFESASADINKRTGLSQDELAKQLESPQETLGSVISLLPELKLQKRLMDRHTNLAHALLEVLKERRIDTYFQAEEDVIAKSAAFTKANLLEHIGASGTGTAQDKLRLLMIYYLCYDVTGAELKEFKLALQDKPTGSGGDAKDKPNGAAAAAAGAGAGASGVVLDDVFFAPLTYLQQWKANNSLSAAPEQSAKPAAAASGFAGLLGLAKSTVAGSGLLSGLMNLLPAAKDLPVTRIVDALMTNRETNDTKNYLYFDSKLGKLTGAKGRLTTPFRDAFVFVMGGGNFTEYQNLQEYARKTQTAAAPKSIVYGATEIVSPKQFVEQLARLGGAPAPAAEGGAGAKKPRASDVD